MTFDMIRRCIKATDPEFDAFETHAVDIYEQNQILVDVRNGKITVVQNPASTEFSPPIFHAIEGNLTEVERREDDFCRLGQKLLRPSKSEAVDSVTVDKVFGILPGLVEHVRSAAVLVERKISHEQSAQIDSKNLLPTSGGTIQVMPATHLPKFDEPVKCETPSGSIVWPFWNTGRWHVAIRRPGGETVLVDPWGKYGRKNLHVGRILQSVLEACALTPIT
jgi:hypothetical protein